MKRWAEISDDGTYRYLLGREWDPDLPAAHFIMLNPSTADGQQDDPTIRRCVVYAKDWGCGSLRVVNLYAYRATAPMDMRRAARNSVDIVGPLNDEHLRAEGLLAAEAGGILVAAWGVMAFPERIEQVRAMPELQNLCYLKLTADGHPSHPLYLPRSLEPLWW